MRYAVRQSLMVAIASRARATFAIAAAAGATLAAALALRPGAPPELEARVLEYADDGFRLTAREVGDHVVVTIAAPAAWSQLRPPLSVVVAIDRSKSMTGEPFTQAQRAAVRLVSQLDAGDAFSIVAYSDEGSTVTPMLGATAAHKELAYRAIEELATDNGTCISCGLTRAAEWLARTPVELGIRRIVLISDGRPNLGLRDPDDLAQLAAETAARGASISVIGVGDDFDEQTMMRIAEVGRGNYYYAEGADALGAAFDREVAGLAGTVATSVRLALETEPGVEIEGVLGHAMAGAGRTVHVPIADLAAGEVRKVVLRVSHATGAPGLIARLGWRRAADGVPRGALALARPAGDGNAAAGGEADGVEQALAGAALERAAGLADPAEARRLLEDHAARLQAKPGLPPLLRSLIRADFTYVAEAFGAAAAGGGDLTKARKLTRELAYRLAR